MNGVLLIAAMTAFVVVIGIIRMRRRAPAPGAATHGLVTGPQRQDRPGDPADSGNGGGDGGGGD